MNVQALVLVLLVGIACYQVYVMVRVVGASEYSRTQKITQAIIIWLVPFLGAGLCHLVLHTTTDRARPPKGRLLEEDDLHTIDGWLAGRRGGARSHPPESGVSVDVSDIEGE